MAEKTRTPVFARIGRGAMGERLGGFIYGTIVVLAVVVAGGRAYPDGAGHIAVLVAVTTAAFWVAHVYSQALARSVATEEHVSLAELTEIARHEAAILEAAIPPVAALVLGTIGILSAKTAVWCALGLGLAVLAAQGIIFARIERLGWLGTLAVVAANLGLGVVIVGLKVLVTH